MAIGVTREERERSRYLYKLLEAFAGADEWPLGGETSHFFLCVVISV